MNRNIRTISVLLALSMATSCTAENSTESSLPHYNSAATNADSDRSSTETNCASPENSDNTVPSHESVPIIETSVTESGNSFEQQQYFGFYCKADSGFYFVDRTGDGYLYHFSNGESTLVLKEYTRALHYYKGKLYYLKGSKEQFDSQQHFYGGAVWCYDTATGEETCVVDGIPDNLCLAVNEYGIFCNPEGGGVALYDFSGDLIRIFTERNQNICVLDNYIYLKLESGCILRNLDDYTTVAAPEMGIIVSYKNGRIIFADSINQAQKYVADIGTGEVKALPESEAYSFAWHDGQLYASDNHHIFRVDLNSLSYEPVITLDTTGPIYIFCLFSDGEKLYAEAVNQSGIAALAEVLIDSKTIDWGDNAV